MAETIPINNPYRSWWSDYAAFHLGLLRRKTLALLDEKGMTQPLFIRHSADDGTALPSGVRDLAERQIRAGARSTSTSSPAMRTRTAGPTRAAAARTWSRPRPWMRDPACKPRCWSSRCSSMVPPAARSASLPILLRRHGRGRAGVPRGAGAHALTATGLAVAGEWRHQRPMPNFGPRPWNSRLPRPKPPPPAARFRSVP